MSPISFSPEANKYFDKERTAYRKLRYHDGPHPNIIGYYGSFVQGGTSNIILEYADRGTLSEYLQQTHEPVNSTAITTFWTQFLGILHGLAHIHNTPIHGTWHHDLIPDNILVVSRNNDYPYDCEFKIADFGLAHFQRFSTTSRKATDKDQHGSNAYSAPEVYRKPASEREYLQVPQNVEIWSMGCILSEVATWVMEGMDKVREYRRRRGEEVLRKAGTNEELFFHNYRVLDAVKQIHHEIKQNSRPTDYITDAVIQRLVKAMMITDHDSRAPAKHFLDQSRQILEEARPAPGHTVSDGMITANRSRWPPNLPPDLEQKAQFSRSSNQYPQQSVPTSLPNIPSTRRPPGQDQHVFSRNIPIPIRDSTGFSDPLYPPLPSPQVPRQKVTDPPLPPHDSLMTGGSIPSSNHKMPASQLTPAAVSPGLQKTVRDDCPYMSVSDGLRIKRKKDAGQQLDFTDEKSFRNLDSVLANRDHVFLVDNVTSMKPYRDDVRNVLELLTSLTSRYDPNGLDLYFTTEYKKHRPNSNKKVLKLFDDHPPSGPADMRACVASIFEPYKAQFGRRDFRRWLSHPTSRPPKGPRKLSLYILTDGIWDPKCDLITEIKALVAGLQKEGMTNKHVGIQFIRFGGDKTAIKRLDTLDSKLQLELDIVDHTPADGNFYKMLLGHLNDQIDDDDKQSLDINGTS
ncbi:MAG: hypothetical protein Q9216_006922 [Gyalolechia sp. 2 TL-2023]